MSVDPKTLNPGDVVRFGHDNPVTVSTTFPGTVCFREIHAIDERCASWGNCELVFKAEPTPSKDACLIRPETGYVNCDVCDTKRRQAVCWPRVSPDSLVEDGVGRDIAVKICAKCLLDGLDLMTMDEDEMEEREGK